MFKNKHFQVKVVKDDTPTYDTTVGDHTDAVSELIARNTKPIAVATVCVIAAKTLSQIAVHAAKTYIK